MASSSSAESTHQDHYGVLGIERRATFEDVRSAYRLRSHMFHPDKYENYPEPLRTQLLAEAAKEFKKLTTAYDTLRDPQKRASYDRQSPSWGYGRASTAPRAAAPRPAPTRAPARATKRATKKESEPRATVRDAAEAEAEDEQKAQREADRRAQREERTRRAAEAAARPRERDPMLVVRPDSLDFGAIALGASKQLPVKIANAGGRTLFGEVTSNRAWLSVNRRSFVSSSVLILVSVDTNGLRAGEEYTGALAVTTLNGGDQVVPVSVRVSGKPEPLLAGVPSLLDFGTAEAGTSKTRTIRLTNAGTGTLIGSVATRVNEPGGPGGNFPQRRGPGDKVPGSEHDIHAFEWLTVSESRFRANDFSFEVTARTAGMLPGDHEGEVLVLTNGGQARVKVLLNVTAGPGAMTRGARTNGAASPDTSPESTSRDDNPGANPAVADLSKDDRTQLLKRIVLIEPETVWERDFLRRIVHLIRSGTELAPGELAKIYELEARQPATQEESPQAMKPIGILYEHPEWFKLLFAELERRGIAYEKLYVDEHWFDPTERESAYSLVVNRVSPSSYLRGHAGSILYARQYLSHLAQLGTPTVNGDVAYTLETSKALQLLLFERLGVRYPQARVVNHPSQLVAAADGLTYPVIVKPNVGGSGALMQRFDSPAALAIDALTLDFGIDRTALVQEYLAPEEGAIVRVEVLNGEALYAIKIFTDPNEGFNLCPADICQVPGMPAPGDGSIAVQLATPPMTENSEACDFGAAALTPTKKPLKIEAFDAPREVVDTAIRLVREGGLDVGGVEYLVAARDGLPYFYDVNALSNFVTDAINVVGLDPTARFVDYLEQRAGIRQPALV